MEITYQNYLDAVYGGWLGKCIGGAIGAMQENNKGLLDYTIDNVFPAEIPPNDDLDLQVLWLQEVLEKKGTSFTSEDIDSESIQGEKLLAAMESTAFFEQDIRRLLACGLSFVTAGSRLERCVRSVLGWYEAGLPWRETRGRLIREFGSADASYSVVNIGIIVMALLYGERDYSKTLMIAVNSGYDTDCTAATAGAILGQMLGAKRIPDFWKEKIGQTVVIPSRRWPETPAASRWRSCATACSIQGSPAFRRRQKRSSRCRRSRTTLRYGCDTAASP